MPQSGTHVECNDGLQFPEAVRLLWEGTQKALEESGMDREDVAALCDIIIRLADHRSLLLRARGSPEGSEPVAERLSHYRHLAEELRQRAAALSSEPNWNEVAEKLRSAGEAACPEE